MSGQLWGSSQDPAGEEVPATALTPWLPPPVTATPCRSARWFHWGCCYLGWRLVPAEEEESATQHSRRNSMAVLRLGRQRAVGCQQAAKMECTGL